MGITSRLAPTENTSLGASVGQYDLVPDPEDNPNKPEGKQDIDLFAEFMRATKAPPRDPARSTSADAVAGSALFDRIGCNVCHVRTLTSGSGSSIQALNNKVYTPFSDFLLHDMGPLGDNIGDNGTAGLREMRTAPLWGLRLADAKHQLLHDGRATSLSDAIMRHEIGRLLGNAPRRKIARAGADHAADVSHPAGHEIAFW